jgi:hypothetical protein
MEQLGSKWRDVHDVLYLSIFRISAQIIQVSLKSDKNNRYFPSRPLYIGGCKNVKQSRYRPGVAQRVPGS